MKQPVILNYYFDEVLGGAEIQDDGSVVVRFIDPRIKDMVEQNRKEDLRALSMSHRPAVPVDHRCLSEALVIGHTGIGFPKRCIRAVRHVEPHAWLEDSRVIGSTPICAEWNDGDVTAKTVN